MSGDIYHQGSCGACYAFAGIDSVSAALAIYYYTFNVAYSHQEMIDCPSNGLSFGCFGGFLESSFVYMINYGISTAYRYPYASDLTGEAQECLLENRKIGIKTFISDFNFIESQQCQDVKKALMSQPIAIGIAGYPLVYYRSGVFDGCTATDVHDHAVLLVGYVQGKGWKIKNSWGSKWG